MQPLPDNKYNTFDQATHLQSPLSKDLFNSVELWDFGWVLLEPLNIAAPGAEEIALSKRLSPGQKALYFFWYLDAEVTNGGFVQFYLNERREYLPSIINGLELVGDTELLQLIERADAEYMQNKLTFDAVINGKAYMSSVRNIQAFEDLDNKYYQIHDHTMSLIERYARLNPSEFVKFD